MLRESAAGGAPIDPHDAHRMIEDSLRTSAWFTVQESSAAIAVIRELDTDHKMELIVTCQRMIRRGAAGPDRAAANRLPHDLRLPEPKRHFPMQSCLAFPLYLTRCEWAVLLDAEATQPQVMRSLLTRCRELGICNVTEPTARAIWCSILLARTPKGRTAAQSKRTLFAFLSQEDICFWSFGGPRDSKFVSGG